MKYFVSIALCLIFFLIFSISYKRNKDIFSPLCFFSLMQFLNYCPSLVYKNSEHYGLFTDENCLLLFFCESVFCLAVVFGYFVCGLLWRKFFFSKRPLHSSCHERNVPLWIILFVFFIGLAAKAYVIVKIGGISYVLTHAAEAYTAQSSGFGYISLLFKFMVIGILAMFEKTLRDGWAKRDRILLICMVLIYMSSYLIYSSRGPAFEIVFVLIFCIHYCYKKFSIKSIFNIKFLLLIFSFAAISFVAVSLRNANNPSADKSKSLVSFLESFFSEMSRSGRDVFTYSYFSEHAKWNGSIYLNLLTTFLPSNVFPWKPVVDDGLYLINLANGNLVSPNSSFADLTIKSGSIPFTTQGLAFANFGFLGILFSGLFMGLFYWLGYFSLSSHKTPFFVCGYFYLVYMFGLTTLLIANVAQVFLFILGGEICFVEFTQKNYILRSQKLC